VIGNKRLTSPLLQSKLFWIGILYFSEGFPLGVFYDVFPVHFRQQGVNLAGIGLLSLLGLTWTLKFLWAPAVDHYRHHRRWMFGADILMGAILLIFA
jgi:MFS transporter, PAT family, beta-lactamase induction signal transducer AmpG